jgi:hypothetical protein
MDGFNLRFVCSQFEEVNPNIVRRVAETSNFRHKKNN